MAKKIVFGSGSLFGVNSAANSTPVQFGTLQSVSIDFAFSTKELFGQQNFPITVARGTCKITGKASNANFQARAFNDLFFAGTLATGRTVTAIDEAGTVPTTPFQVTVTNGATFVGDLGVTEALTGTLMERVASSPTTGQYSVSGLGVYTFAAADTAKAVRISYQYTVAAAPGKKLLIAQQLIGVAPKFKVVLSTRYDGQQIDLQLNACVASKLSFATKQEDFAMPDFEFAAFADDGGNVGEWSFPDQA